MGIEPTYSAWKADVLPLNHTCISNRVRKWKISIGVTGFEPATSWSQTRRSSQAEPHPVIPCDANIIILQGQRNVNTLFQLFLFFFLKFCLLRFPLPAKAKTSAAKPFLCAKSYSFPREESQLSSCRIPADRKSGHSQSHVLP